MAAKNLRLGLEDAEERNGRQCMHYRNSRLLDTASGSRIWQSFKKAVATALDERDCKTPWAIADLGLIDRP